MSVLGALALSTTCAAQTASILPNARTQFIDANGNPVVGGTVTFYIPSTTTPKTTWQDAGETTPNSNPVVLDGLGSAKIWGDGSYRQVVKDSLGNVIWDAVTSSTGGGGGGGSVSSINGATGAVTIAAGTNVTIGTVGSTITVNATGGGGGGGAVANFASIANLRANTSAASPSALVQAYYSTSTGGGGNFYIKSSDTTSLDNNCTIIVDAGSHRWYRSYSGPLDARYCGAKGDGTTDDTTAVQSAIAISKSVFLSAGNYRVTSSLALGTGASISGAGLTNTTITAVKTGTPYPIITTTAVTTSPSPLGPCDTTSNYVYSLCKISVSDLTLDTTGSVPVAGDDGISFPQYTDNTTVSSVFIKNQWNGLTLGPADGSFLNNVTSTTNYNNGIEISNSTYGALQWNFNGVFATQNESDGIYAHVNVGAGYVGLYNYMAAPTPLTQVTLGTWTNIATFANAIHGVAVTGNATGPVAAQGVRIVQGFYGQDGSDEIYLDTYNTGGGAHTIEPNYIELAGTGPTGRTLQHPASGIGSGIYTTSSVGPLIVRTGAIKQNSYDGITSNGSALLVDGGLITDNGTWAPVSTMVNGFSYTIQVVGTTSFTSFGAGANTVGTVFTKSGGVASGSGLVSSTGRSNGIFINSGGAGGIAITGIQGGNTSGNTSQLYGVSSNVDYVAISGSNLLNNTTSAVTGTAMTNSVASGNLPIAINTGGGGGGGSYCALSGCTMTGPLIVNSTLTTSGLATVDSLSVTHAASMNGGLTMVGATGITGANSGITMKDIQASRSMGVGSTGVADGVDGHLIAGTAMVIGAPTGGFQSGSINVPTAVLVNNVGIAVGSYCALTGCTMTGPLVVNSSAQVQSLGIGAAADGTTGHITGPGGGLAFAGGTNVNFTGSTTTSGTVQANTGFYGNGTAVVSGITTVTASGQVQGQDLYATRSLGVQTSPSTTAGRIDAGALSYFPQGINAGTASTFPNAFHGGVTIADGGMTFTTGVAGNGLTVDNINVIKSVGIGVAPSGSTGQLAVSAAAIIGTPTGSYQSFALNVQGSLLVNNVAVGGGSYCALSGCTMTGSIAMGGNNITGAGAITASGQVQAQDLYATRSVGISTAPDGVTGHIAGTPLAFTGASINMTGALAVTGNVQMASLYATTSAGIGTSPSGTSGRLDVGGIVVGSPIGGFATGNVNAAGTVYGGVGVVSFGAMSWTSCLYNTGAFGLCLGTGTINAATGIYLNSSAYTNP